MQTNVDKSAKYIVHIVFSDCHIFYTVILSSHKVPFTFVLIIIDNRGDFKFNSEYKIDMKL